MAIPSASLALRHLRHATRLRQDASLSDGQLLERYLARRDEAAFESLVLRHGPMVLGVCRRVLKNEADAEDAFQATFLVLVLKATSIRSRGLLGNWLYGVAHNTARKAKAMNRVRRAKELETSPRGKESRDDGDLRELHDRLDTEVSRLPETYRAAIVACDLEGKTIKEAAATFGWPQGTVATRLRRGRALLAKRLASQAVTLPASLVATAAVPASLVSATVQAATGVAVAQAVTTGLVSAPVAALIQGVMNSMLLTKLKTTAVAFAILFLGLGGSLLSQSRSGDAAAVATLRGTSDDNLKNTLLALDKHLWEASARGDWRERQKFLADDLVSISILGKYGKADAASADQRLRCTDWTIADAEVARVSKDVAVLYYRYSCKVLSTDGQLVDTRKDHRVTYVWANRKGGWVMTYCHDDHGRLAESVSSRFKPTGVRGLPLDGSWFTVPMETKPANFPAGEWAVEFNNGVTEVLFISPDRTVKVVEKNRTAVGKAVIRDGDIVVTYRDDRVERLTWSGKRLVVEHWFPANRYPNGRPVLGVAEKREGAAKIERVPLKYIQATEAAKALAKVGGGEGSRMATDERTNSVILSGTEEQVARYKAKLCEIDKRKQ